ncbi:MAG TPA: hypothetical protein VJZ72_03035 [Candidatus Limnocylindrales bacterium]|nr:hypothetical protein [Candidatus Limnocylindrales bacterium]
MLTWIAVVAIVVAQPWATQPTTGSPSPTPGQAPSTSPSGSPVAEPPSEWAPVSLQPIPAVATLEAGRGDEAGVQPDTTFRLASLTDEPAASLAARLEATPPTAFVASAGSDPTEAVLRPKTALTPGSLYRIALRGPDGSLAGSWAFRVRTAVHVINVIPGDQTTGIPNRTGIEITFDQDGVADMADHFSIVPKVDGRFERHGRTQVFVPAGLVDKTVYTVTVRSGLARTGTDLTLESDVVMRFETEGPTDRAPRLRFGRDVVESSPAEAPILAVQTVSDEGSDEEQPTISSADVRVYRLPSLAKASETLRAFILEPRWTAHSEPSMPTDGLPVAATFSSAVEPLPESAFGVIRFPEPLAEGWYIVEIQGERPTQAFLQSTPVSAWVSVLTDKTVAWVNDVKTARPIKGAEIALAGGAKIGKSDESGLMIAATPDALIPAAEAGDRAIPDGSPILIVRAPGGHAMLIPFGVGSEGGIYRGEWYEKNTSADSTYWSILSTDRTMYRTTDRVEVWGYLRGRDDDKVPASVEIRLVNTDSAELAEPPAIVRATARPNASGAFTASLPIAQAPIGSYQVQVVVDTRVVSRHWVDVTVIRKPAYQFAVKTDHTAVIVGTKVRWSITATFFDNTPVPGTSFRLDDDVTTKPTDATGRTSIQTVAQGSEESEDASGWYREIRPAVYEEAEIFASENVVVFPSAYHLAANGTVKASRLSVTGTLDKIDLKKVEAQIAKGTWDGVPDGAPVRAKAIRAVVTELIPVRRLVGNDYDFIEKVVRPRYEYDIRRRAVRTLTVKTRSDGRFSLGITVPDPKHDYEIVLTTTDGAGRRAKRTITAGRAPDLSWENAGVRFMESRDKEAGESTYRIGARVKWQMTDDGRSLPSTGPNRYLYIVAQRGLRSASVTDSSTFDRRFAPGDAPGIFVMGVRFTGSTYAPKASAWANFNQSQREIKVVVTADKKRYRPRDDVRLTIRTTDATGKPIAASVVLQAVDEKLYAIDGASTPQPLSDLYARVDSGIVRLTSTHQVPTIVGPEGEGGDTAGGGGDGGRIDFRDTLAFRAVKTDRSGRTTTTIRLSDDLTSWHVAASAVTGRLRAGVGEVLIPVGLPLFADATIADEYLSSDRPTIRLRAFGDALKVGDPVEFTVSSTSLGLAATRVGGKAFRDVTLALPALAVGSHSLDISVTAPTRLDGAGKPRRDRLIRKFEVVRSRLTTAHVTYLTVGDKLPDNGTADPATYTFTDAGRARYLPVLYDLVEPVGARYDRGLAQSLAGVMLTDTFGRDPRTLPVATFDATRYPIGVGEEEAGEVRAGIALLPYGGADPWLATRVGIIASESGRAETLREVLTTIRDLESSPRDLSIATLAGLAALGEPVTADLEAARGLPDLTTSELIHIGLGFQTAGDDPTALLIERDVLEREGQRLGPWVRVKVGSNLDDTVDATALMAVLAAGLGDPLAADMIDYVAANPSRQTSHALELAGAVERALERTPATAASFAYAVDGRRTVVRLEAGDAVTLTLTAAQRRTLTVERISGRVGAAISWRDQVDVASIRPDPALSLTRTPPKNPLPTDRLVTVDFDVTFKASALESGCYEVVETAPSGLAPTTIGSDEGGAGVVYPTSVVGQTVTFCASNDRLTKNRAHLRYTARVVNAGSFAWEPAVMQLSGVPEAIAVSAASTARIGGS